MRKARKTPPQEEPLGIDVDQPQIAEGNSTPAPRQDNRPVCPTHKRQMVAYSTSAMYTYYRCPEEGCGCRDKRLRPIGPLRGKYGIPK